MFGICFVLQMVAQEHNYFTNPVIRGDVPDPSVIRVEDTYYATGTSSEWAPFYPMFTSKDLVNWKQVGHVFTKQPSWTSNSFWAPELFYHNNKVYCYYTARQKSTGISYIGVATSDSPLHEFTDHGPIVEYGKEAIDAFIYDDNGQLYISWKAYGLDTRPIELLGCKLSADGLHLDGEPFTLLVDEKGIGMEGQYHFKKGDYYYIVYAAHGCCGPSSDYDVYVARACYAALCQKRNDADEYRLYRAGADAAHHAGNQSAVDLLRLWRGGAYHRHCLSDPVRPHPGHRLHRALYAGGRRHHGRAGPVHFSKTPGGGQLSAGGVWHLYRGGWLQPHRLGY